MNKMGYSGWDVQNRVQGSGRRERDAGDMVKEVGYIRRGRRGEGSMVRGIGKKV